MWSLQHCRCLRLRNRGSGSGGTNIHMEHFLKESCEFSPFAGGKKCGAHCRWINFEQHLCKSMLHYVSEFLFIASQHMFFPTHDGMCFPGQIYILVTVTTCLFGLMYTAFFWFIMTGPRFFFNTCVMFFMTRVKSWQFQSLESNLFRASVEVSCAIGNIARRCVDAT